MDGGAATESYIPDYRIEPASQAMTHADARIMANHGESLAQLSLAWPCRKESLRAVVDIAKGKREKT